MTSERPRIAIILLNWNAYDYTRACLASLASCDSSLFDAIVVDNDSSDDSIDRIEQEFTDTIILRNPVNGGFTGGNNVGIRYAVEKSYEFLMLLNNDTEVAPGFLEPLLRRLDENPSLAAVQPKIYFNHDRELLWNAGGVFNKWLSLPVTIGEGKKDDETYDEPKTVDWLTACCILTRTEIVREVGGQNEAFFYGSFDDVDWSFRLKNGNRYKLFYEPNSVIYHDAGVAGKSKQPGKEGFLKPFVHYLTNRNNLFFIRLHTTGFYLPSTVVFHLVRSMIYLTYFVIRGRFQKFRAAFWGMMDGLRVKLDRDIDHIAAIKKINS